MYCAAKIAFNCLCADWKFMCYSQVVAKGSGINKEVQQRISILQVMQDRSMLQPKPHGGTLEYFMSPTVTVIESIFNVYI